MYGFVNLISATWLLVFVKTRFSGWRLPTTSIRSIVGATNHFFTASATLGWQRFCVMAGNWTVESFVAWNFVFDAFLASERLFLVLWKDELVWRVR